MIDINANIPLLSCGLLFLGLLAIGLLAVLPLYQFNWHKLLHSKLFVKIMMWAPIFFAFMVMLYLTPIAQLGMTLLIVGMMLKEAWPHLAQRSTRWLVLVYTLVIGSALVHLALFKYNTNLDAVGLLVIICFASVLGDVLAFFMGNYLGQHKLPAVLNENKSWEGVAGELLGAGLGVLLVHQFIGQFADWTIFIPIGLGSAIGDLTNSYVKRRLNIKEWSNNLPGHGGYLDRFSSLSIALALTFYWVVIG